ncbi:MAG: AAA family ATPase [Eubacterium sp.]|jgi:Protein of unknown function (DUF1703)./Predicted AAA-ATPase.|nr:AAA family ATPase [Eubacterium sp.]
MNTVVSIGNQNFGYMREHGSFYIDKTDFIREWWENQDDVTLITRPRRFGKTLNMSMMECFFSVNYADRGDLFERLSIWENERYRKVQGSWPVLSFSFAEIKGRTYSDTREGFISILQNLYEKHNYLLQGNTLSEDEKKNYYTFGQYVEKNPITEITDNTIARAVKNLMKYMVRHFKSKVIVFLDEYDTPLQEAYIRGYWGKLTPLIRSMFNSTFKTNEYLYRAILTGITRVSKESIFSDLNNLMVVGTSTDRYCSAFGFTEDEVFQSLEERGLAGEMDHIRFWYDGFTFGSKTGIYNPWSITKFLDSREYGTYWADTSSNALVSELIKTGTPELKMQMEELITGGNMKLLLDEQVVFEQLKKKKGAIWSLMVASGYLKPEERIFCPEEGKFSYNLKITNHEVELMFRDMITSWFPEDATAYGNFKEALIIGDLDYMNQYMNEVAEEMFSSFDTGRKPSEKKQPERFYHGFVLGLIVDLAGRYRIRSNRESGLGRYDVMMEPIHETDDAVIMEFKVFSKQKDQTLEKAVENALAQINDMKYDTELMARGIKKERIRHYGFVFDGQTVLIGQ